MIPHPFNVSWEPARVPLRPVLPRDVVVLLRCLVPSRCLVLRRDVDVAGVLLPNDSILRARFYLYIIYLSRPPKK